MQSLNRSEESCLTFWYRIYQNRELFPSQLPVRHLGCNASFICTAMTTDDRAAFALVHWDSVATIMAV